MILSHIMRICTLCGFIHLCLVPAGCSKVDPPTKEQIQDASGEHSYFSRLKSERPCPPGTFRKESAAGEKPTVAWVSLPDVSEPEPLALARQLESGDVGKKNQPERKPQQVHRGWWCIDKDKGLAQGPFAQHVPYVEPDAEGTEGPHHPGFSIEGSYSSGKVDGPIRVRDLAKLDTLVVEGEMKAGVPIGDWQFSCTSPVQGPHVHFCPWGHVKGRYDSQGRRSGKWIWQYPNQAEERIEGSYLKGQAHGAFTLTFTDSDSGLGLVCRSSGEYIQGKMKLPSWTTHCMDQSSPPCARPYLPYRNPSWAPGGCKTLLSLARSGDAALPFGAWPETMSKRLTKADLKGMSKDELSLMRNEIYARKGRRFKSQRLQDTFKKQTWYHPLCGPEDFDDSVLSDIERANAKFIRQLENQ